MCILLVQLLACVICGTFFIRTSELDFMIEGMKDLCVGLVNVDQLVGHVQVSKEKCIALGTDVLGSIVQKYPSYLPTLMNEFLKNKTSRTNSSNVISPVSFVHCYYVNSRLTCDPEALCGRTCSVIPRRTPDLCFVFQKMTIFKIFKNLNFEP